MSQLAESQGGNVLEWRSTDVPSLVLSYTLKAHYLLAMK